MSSCRRSQHQHRQNLSLQELQPDSIMQLYHAKGFSISYYPSYKRVEVFNPWGGKSAVYYLYHAGENAASATENMSSSCEKEACSAANQDVERAVAQSVEQTVAQSVERAVASEPGAHAVKIPLQSVALCSCSHVAMLDALSLLSVVKGVCNPHLVYNQQIQEMRLQGFVQDLGDNFSLNAEKVLALRSQAFFKTSYGQFDNKTAFLQESGLPVIEVNEWMEADLLARAEWIRFVAAFFDEEAQADSIYRETLRSYQALKDLAAGDDSNKKSILPGENFRGTWYVPGGRSYMAQLFRDAGGDYLYASDSTSGSLSLNVERVLRDMSQSDVWVGVSATDKQDLASKDPRYALFSAFKQGEVYAYDRATTPEGGNDFWETAVVHPEYLLSDFVKLLHPQLLPEQQWYYLRKLH